MSPGLHVRCLPVIMSRYPKTDNKFALTDQLLEAKRRSG